MVAAFLCIIRLENKQCWIKEVVMKTKGLNAFQLKLFMALLMVFDHLGKIPGLLSGEWEGIFHALTRCVAVWFAFAAVEGFRYTRSRFL